MYRITLLILGLFAFSTLTVAQEENPGLSCTEAAKLYEEGDLDGAIEEATWCVEAMRQEKQQQAVSTLPDEVNGYVGGEVQNQQGMGMSIIQRVYSKDGAEIDLNLTKGAGAAGGFAAIAQMGLGMSGGKKFRVQRRTVLDMSEAGETQLMVSLKSGGMLTLTSTSAAHDDVVAFIKAFPLAKLDDSLAGN